MAHLIDHLHGLHNIEKEGKSLPLWIQSLLYAVAILLVILVVYFCARYKPFQKFWSTKWGGKILQPTVPPAVPDKSGDGSHIFRGHNSTQPETSAPIIVTTSTSETRPLVYPVIELAASPATDKPANIYDSLVSLVL